MKIGVISDLHVDYNRLTFGEVYNKIEETIRKNGLDAFFICGDLTNSKEKTHQWLVELNYYLSTEGLCTVYYIQGNHDEYGSEYKEFDEYTNNLNHKVLPLTLGEKTINVIGWSGWYDYSFVEKEIHFDAESYLKDFKHRYWSDAHYILRDCTDKEYYAKEYKWLKESLTKLKDESPEIPTVLLTHFVPSEKGVIRKGDYIWDTCNAFMGSRHSGSLMEEYNVNHVFFGHTHTVFEFKNGNTHYYGVPLGYINREWFDFDFRWSESLQVLEF